MEEEKILKIVYGVILFFVIVGIFYITPLGRASINKYVFNLEKVDEATEYKTLKQVEDTCRAMISSYEADKLVYEQYNGSDNEEKQSWADQAKMRANRTAVNYNNYILENSFVWKNNVPDDISEELKYIE